MLTDQERQNISGLLLSEDASTKMLALELLKTFSEYIPSFQPEIALSIYFFNNYAWENAFRQFFLVHFNQESLVQHASHLKLFRAVDQHSTFDNMAVVVRPLLDVYHEHRHLYEPSIAQTPSGIDRYAKVIYKLSACIPQDDRLLDYHCFILQHRPTSVYWGNKGRYHFLRREYPLAIQAFEQALLLNPMHASAASQLGCIHFYLKDYTQSAHYYQIAAQYHRDPVWKARSLVSVVAAMRCIRPVDVPAAQAIFEQALPLAPKDAMVLNSWGTFLRDYIGNIPKAIDMHQKVLEVCYRYESNALVNLGEIFAEELHQYTKAAAYYDLLRLYAQPLHAYASITLVSFFVHRLPDYDKAFPIYLHIKRRLKSDQIQADETYCITPQQWDRFYQAAQLLLDWKRSKIKNPS